MGNPPEPADLRALARSVRRLNELTANLLDENAPTNQLVLRVTSHLGCELSEVVPVTEQFKIWEHVNVQRGIDAYLAAHGSTGAWFGAGGGAGHRPDEGLLALIMMSKFMPMFELGAAKYGTVPVGPDENTAVVQLGLIASAAPDGTPVMIGIHSATQFGPPQCSVEVLAADTSTAAATCDEIGRLIRAKNVFRGQVLSFSETEHHGNELVSFLPRPAVTAPEVILPDGVLDLIEQHIVGIGSWSRALLGSDAGNRQPRPDQLRQFGRTRPVS